MTRTLNPPSLLKPFSNSLPERGAQLRLGDAPPPLPLPPAARSMVFRTDFFNDMWMIYS